jgi:hypothetical protein
MTDANMNPIHREMLMAMTDIERRSQRTMKNLAKRLDKGTITPKRAVELINLSRVRYEKQCDDVLQLSMAKMLAKFNSDLDMD